MSQALAEMLQRDIERAFMGGNVTTNALPQGTSLDVRKLLPELERMLRNFRRTQLVFIVDRAHQGGPLRHVTPNDGERIELSWLDADRLHQEWPLKLHQVLSEDAAEFVPALIGEFVAKHLPLPPFEMPPEETFQDWLRGDYKNPPPA